MSNEWETMSETVIETLDRIEKSLRIEAIDDLIHRLQFERRWQSLVPNQVRHMTDESLNTIERQKLEACKTESQREELIDGYARVRYFRRCHWLMYLNGESEDPPIAAEADGQKASTQ